MLETMKAAIFDMDGTLLDSMTQWRRMNGAFVREMGIEPTEKQEADMMSMSGTMVVDYFRSEFGIDTDFEALCVRACEAMEPVYSGGVPHKPGAAAYLKRLRARREMRHRDGDACPIGDDRPQLRESGQRSGLYFHHRHAEPQQEPECVL